jgi:hypothetical protein
VRVLIGLLVVVAVVVGGVYLYLNRIVATAIESGGTYALGVETGVGSVSIGLISGRFGIGDLSVANPPGFDEPHFMSLDRGSLQVRPRQLLGDPVTIPHIGVHGVRISLERRGGKTNYGAILSHLEQLGGGPAGAEPAPDPEESKGFVIREIVIEDVRAHVSLSGVGGKLTDLDVEVPEIRLRDVGAGSSGGADIARITGLVIEAILGAILSQRDQLPTGLVSDLGGRLRRLDLKATPGATADELRGAAEEGKKAVEGLKGLFRRNE